MRYTVRTAAQDQAHMAASSLVDLVKIYSMTTGTGAITLGTAVGGYRGTEALENGATYSYSIQQDDQFETGKGTFLTSGNLLVRTPITSSNGGGPINLQPNASVAFVALAEDILARDVLQPLYGFGPPLSGQGLPGQVYYDLTAPVTLYGPKDAVSGWGSGVTLQGQDGAPGTAASYRTLADLQAADPAALFYALVTTNGLVNYALLQGDFTGKTDNVNIIKLNAVPLTTGALVRQAASSVSFARASGVTMNLDYKVALRVDIEDFGAVGDGVTDDTAAWEKALSTLANGSTINQRAGARYFCKRTLVFSKAIRLEGTSREQTQIVFDPNGNYLSVGANARATMIFMHPSVVGINGYDGKPLTGYAGRTVIRGVGIVGSSGMPANTNGLFIAAPIYVYETDILSFSGNGALVQAGADTATKGNANGTTFVNCNALGNTLSGYALIGNDANRCVLMGCNAAQNGQYGYYEDSLLGNTYIACEADNNGTGGYYQTAGRPSRSVYIAPYSETAPHFSVNARSSMTGVQGLGSPDRSWGAAYFGGLPSGYAYINKVVAFAASEAVANVMGGAASPGKALSIGEDGIDWRSVPGGGLTRLTNAFGTNYDSIVVNDILAAHLCRTNVTGNLTAGRLWAIGGVAFGVNAAIVGESASIPTGTAFAPGAITLNSAPAAGGNWGWIFTVAGVWEPLAGIGA